MLYRIHQRLLVDSKNNVQIEGGEGCVHTLDMVSKENRAILLQVGAISIVQAPPLSTFTHWAGRARKLDELGIDTIGFITMKPGDVAYAIRASLDVEEDQETFDHKVENLTAAVFRWQGEIRQFLGIDSARVKRCCGN